MSRSDSVKVLSKYGQLSSKPRSAIERVDPSQAAAWLETSKGNRRISQEHVGRIAEDMRDGKYLLTHQGIAFDCDGHLIDGHHTLWAILLSGVSVDLMVTKNLRRETIRVIDTGKNRSLQDRLTLDRTWGQVTRAEAACLRRMTRGHSKSMRRSPSDEYDDWKANHDHIRFAVTISDGLGKGIKLAALRAVIARAHKSVPAEVIQRFCWELKSGRPDALLESLRGKNDQDTYDLTERALWAFSHSGQEKPVGVSF